MQAPRVFLLLLFIGSSLASYAQELRFTAPFSSEEIPQVPIALHQDSRGFMWFGTTDGLYRYDGNEVREFRKNPTDSLSLPNNYIRSITEDHAGNIWVGTDNGIACYQVEADNFRRFPTLFPAQTTIIHLMVDHRNILWISSYLGLFSFDPDEGSLRNFLPDPERKDSSLSHKTVWSTFEDSQQRIWVCTHLGFTLFDNDGQYRLRAYFGDIDNKDGLFTDRVFYAQEQPKGTIWLGTHDGIFRLKEAQDSFHFHRYHSDGLPGKNMSHNFIESFTKEGDDRLWAGTYQGGLNEFILAPGTDSVATIVHHQATGAENALGSNRLKCVFISEQGLVWVGTDRRIELGDRMPSTFGTIGKQSEAGIGLIEPFSRVIFVDSHNNLWVGGAKGLSFLPAEKHAACDYRFQHFTRVEEDPFSLRDDNIVGISEAEEQGLLWIVTQRGAVHYVHLESFAERPQFHRLNKNRLRDYNPIYAVKQYAPRKYWVASAHGFADLRLQAEELKIQSVNYSPTKQGDNLFSGQSPSIINGNSSGLQKDRFGDYWVGTFAGIARIRLVEGKPVFDNYQHEPNQPESLSNNSFRCFYLDAKGRLWVGTRSGLNLVLQEKREDRARFRTFGSTDGLINDVIHAIEEDDRGYLWLSTNRGLVHFNPDAEPGTSGVLQTYTKANGLPHNSFIFRSSARSKTGKLYFGTTAGVGAFHPDSLSFNPYPPRLYFTDLSVLNKAVTPSPAKEAILTRSITSAKQITLRYWQNLVSIRFAALNFRHPERNRYQYRFSALGDQWIDLDHQNQVSFTNIPSGVHVLEVKGSNNDGVWQEESIRLSIQMLPPPWRSWWAYCLYAMAIFSLLYLGFRYRLDLKVAAIKAKMEVENARLETRQRVRDRNAADFHDELGHRLTKILLFTELAERENEMPSVGGHLQKIKSVTSGLSTGIRDLIWSLDTQQDTLFATVVRLREFGDQLFAYTESRFRTEGINKNLEEVPLSPEERKHTLLLFKEAMNNALKYAQADLTTLRVQTDPDGIRLTFDDNGVGFSPDKKPPGYGIGNMASRAKKIGATFELRSAPGAGTSIQLRINRAAAAGNTPK